MAEEKRLAYGCILGGHKGFVTRRMYPIFYMTWKVWGLFEENNRLNISQVRKTIGVSRKQGGSAVDAAIEQLQMEYYITVDGNDRKVSAKGEFYGWPVNRYCRVEDWAPAGWLEGAKDWSAAEARELILDDGVAMAEGVTRQELAKKLGFG
jgi:hypothetical protein